MGNPVPLLPLFVPSLQLILGKDFPYCVISFLLSVWLCVPACLSSLRVYVSLLTSGKELVFL